MTARELIQLRKRLGLSQAGLARALEVQPNTTWRWEHGHPMDKGYDGLIRILERTDKLHDPVRKARRRSAVRTAGPPRHPRRVRTLRQLPVVPRMTAREFRRLRARLGLSQHHLGIVLGRTGETVYAWERRREREVDPIVALAMRALIALDRSP